MPIPFFYQDHCTRKNEPVNTIGKTVYMQAKKAGAATPITDNQALLTANKQEGGTPHVCVLEANIGDLDAERFNWSTLQMHPNWTFVFFTGNEQLVNMGNQAWGADNIVFVLKGKGQQAIVNAFNRARARLGTGDKKEAGSGSTSPRAASAP